MSVISPRVMIFPGMSHSDLGSPVLQFTCDIRKGHQTEVELVSHTSLFLNMQG